VLKIAYIWLQRGRRPVEGRRPDVGP